jgi:hypothetical protein
MTSYTDGTAGERVPSRASVLVLILVGSALMFGTFWLMTGPVFDGRHLVGVMLGVVATATTLVQAIDRATTRHLAMMEREFALRERAANTATWYGPDDAVALTIRWDPAERTYYAAGRLPSWSDPDWTERPLEHWETHSLGVGLRSDWTPADDEGTRAMYARLMLPGWRDMIEVPPGGGSQD